MKTCPRCEITKDEREFSKNRKRIDGLQCYCKKCNRLHQIKSIENKPGRELKRKLETEKRANGLKVCTKCGIEKKVSEFHKHKRMKDGYKSECKKCRSHHNDINKEIFFEALPENMRRCRICNSVKEMSEFRKKRRVCNKCLLVQRIEHYNKNKKRDNDNNKRYRDLHNERINGHKREYMRAHLKTPAGKLVGKRHNDKRRRELGWNPINKWFKGSDGHHFRYTNDINSPDNDIGLYAPRELHKSIIHNGNTGKNMAVINKRLLEWYLNNTSAEERNKQAVQLYWDYCTMPEPGWNES